MKQVLNILACIALLQIPVDLGARDDIFLRGQLEQEIVQLFYDSGITMDENDEVKITFRLDDDNVLRIIEHSLDGTPKGERIERSLDEKKMKPVLRHLDRGIYKVTIRFK